MKTIRNGVFETNSSSTHSISIQKIGARNLNKVPRSLLIDNILHPEYLSDYTEVVVTYGEGYITTCRTKEEKASLLIHWLVYSYKWENLSLEDFNKFVLKIQEATGYDSINTDFSPDFSPNDDHETFILNYKSIYSYINTILDPTMEIIDSNMPY